jgi:hypothetical protein
MVTSNCIAPPHPQKEGIKSFCNARGLVILIWEAEVRKIIVWGQLHETPSLKLTAAGHSHL